MPHGCHGAGLHALSLPPPVAKRFQKGLVRSPSRSRWHYGWPGPRVSAREMKLPEGSAIANATWTERDFTDVDRDVWMAAGYGTTSQI